MITVASIKPNVHIKQDQSLHIDIITIGIIDAFHHFPDAFQRKSDISALATKFAMCFLQMQQEDNKEQQESDDIQKKRYSMSSAIGNYIAGYLFGKHLCDIANDEECQIIIDTFHKIDDGNDDDDMLSLVFDAIKKSIEGFVKTMGVGSVSDFAARVMQDDVDLMQVIGSNEEILVSDKN